MKDFRQELYENGYFRQEELCFADCDRYQRARVSGLLNKAAAYAGYDYNARGLTHDVLFELSLRIVVNYLNLVLNKATKVADSSTIVELGAQVCLAGIFAAILVYISAKVAAALAGASATVSMQGLAAVGIGAAAFGAGKLAGGAVKETKRSAQDNIQGWKDANAGKPGKPGGELGYNASKARKYAIEQMIARNEARRLAQSRESAVKKFNS